MPFYFYYYNFGEILYSSENTLSIALEIILSCYDNIKLCQGPYILDMLLMGIFVFGQAMGVKFTFYI